MKILVTGGTGFLGSYLVRRLAADGHAVTVLRRASSSMGALAGVGVREEIGDVGDAQDLLRAAAEQDVVVHAAAGVTGDGALTASHEVNVTGTRNAVEACLGAGVRRLVHVSSVAAIGIPHDRTPATEQFVFNLDGSRIAYHLSKRAAEDVVREGVTRGLDAVIVNPGALWGPFGDSYRGAAIVPIVRGARRLRVTPGGVCIAHVEDVAAGIAAAIEHGASGARYILGGDNLTNRDWLTKIAHAIGASPQLVPFPRIASELLATALRPLVGFRPTLYGPYLRAYLAGRYMFYDSSKAAAELSYSARSFDAILDECMRFDGARASTPKPTEPRTT